MKHVETQGAFTALFTALVTALGQAGAASRDIEDGYEDD